jgi:putative membrane-bound dehydrogenase-like protein
MRFLVPLVILAIVCDSRLNASDKPIPPNEAPAKMTLPEGFRVTLFAGEPDIVQPIAFTFDDRGRMWVVECLSYPNWSKDGTGKDRVVILEDTDGDGRFDKKTVFLDNGSNLSGIEFGFGGVWLCSSPNLLFIPVKDDKPAGAPQVVLDGWNVRDTKHNVFNSLAWGPDGWLYGCNGIQAKAWVGAPGTPQKDRTYMDCGVWRYQPTAKKFEVFASGTTNPWGLDWDDYGQLFITNCVIDHLWHVVPGGHYQRMYGEDANPYVFGLMGPCSDHRHWGGGHWTTARADQKTGAMTQANDAAGGGHAHSGCMVYLGDNFPADYRNSVFMCNIHGNRLNRDSLHRQGSGYVGKHEKDFLFANDPWFRGICVKQGPEGALYVSDWTDTGECHNYDRVDASNGRIYRVTFGTPKPFRGDVSKMTDAELVRLQASKNEWLVRHARRILQERSFSREPKASADVAGALHSLVESQLDVPQRLRALWALHVTRGLTDADCTAMIQHPEPTVRMNAPILALENPARSKLVRELLSTELAADSDPLVRRALAGQFDKLDGYFRVTAQRQLFEKPADRDTTLMLWYAIEPNVRVDTLKELGTLSPQVSGFVVRRLLADQDAFHRVLGQCVSQLKAEWPDEVKVAVLRAIRESLAGHRSVTPPEQWKACYDILVASRASDVREAAIELALLFGDERAIVALAFQATHHKDPASRIRAIELLAPLKRSEFGDMLRKLLSDPAVRGAAVRGLAAYADAETPAAILKHYAEFTAAEKADAVQTLSSRPTFAAALLDAIAKGAVPRGDVTAFHARQIQALNDKVVSVKLATVWGTVKPASQTRAAQTAKLKALLTPDTLKAANPANGRGLFAKSCAACHKLFGEGGDVGPELTGSQRANLDYVLENVLDPNAVVPGEYRMTAFYLTDGRVVTGLVRRETPQAVTVRTANEEIVIPKGDIELRKATPNSVMPEGLLDQLKDDEVRDLVAYLASPRQVPLPGGK